MRAVGYTRAHAVVAYEDLPASAAFVPVAVAEDNLEHQHQGQRSALVAYREPSSLAFLVLADTDWVSQMALEASRQLVELPDDPDIVVAVVVVLAEVDTVVGLAKDIAVAAAVVVVVAAAVVVVVVVVAVVGTVELTEV